MSSAATPMSAWSGRRRLNPISSAIPFSKWRKRGWRRLCTQEVSHGVAAGAILAKRLPMEARRNTRQRIGRSSDAALSLGVPSYILPLLAAVLIISAVKVWLHK